MARERTLCILLLAALAACGGEAEPASETGVAAVTPAAPAPVADAAAEGGPPQGRYVCRQGATTMGYLALELGGEYEVSGVRGRYRFDGASGAMEWEGGSYDEWGWEGRYDHVQRPEGDGRPDEDIVRLTSEADGLNISCYRMTEE